MKKVVPFLLFIVFTINASAQKGGIAYENRTDLLKAPDCNPSEIYLKKKVKSQLANYYTDYPFIAVDFTSFKGQNGYTDKKDPKKFIYPYKIEMLVYLKRKIMKEGKERTECITWKYDSVYEYTTQPGKKCDLNIVPSSQTTQIKHQVF
jgi:hypothetical protein